MTTISSVYLQDVLSINLQKVITKTTNAIIYCMKKGMEFDAIAFRGMSGALVAPSVAANIKKPLIMVRKPNNSHSNYVIEGAIFSEKYIIIDDMIATGDTIDRIINDVSSKRSSNIVRCVGIFLYLPKNGTSYGFTQIEERYHIPVYGIWTKRESTECSNSSPRSYQEYGKIVLSSV